VCGSTIEALQKNLKFTDGSCS